MPAFKRPASSSGSQATVKRPAAKGAFNQALGAMKEGLKDNQEDKNPKAEDAEDDDDAADAGLRDKGKGIKFAQMRSTLPPHILDLYDKEALSKSSPRAFRTNIVNQLFEKTDGGRYRLRDDRPMFTEAKRLFEKKYGKNEQHGFPKSVMRGLYFGNSESALQDAISCGDVYLVKGDDDREYYAFRQVTTGSKRWVCIIETGGQRVCFNRYFELLWRVVLESCSERMFLLVWAVVVVARFRRVNITLCA